MPIGGLVVAGMRNFVGLPTFGTFMPILIALAFRQTHLGYGLALFSLVVAAGADQSYFGNDHFGEWAPGMKTIDHALELRGRIYGAFELAEADPASGRLETWLTFVVVGAGPTGVEMAGQIAELAKRTLPGNFRRVDTTRARVILLDAAPRVLGAFSEHFAAVAARRLEALGVELRLNSKVVDVSQYGIEVEHGDGAKARPNGGWRIAPGSSCGQRLGMRSTKSAPGWACIAAQ